MRHGLLTAVSLWSLVAGCVVGEESDDGPSADLLEAETRATNACQAIPLEVIVKGRENRFGLNGQQVALNPSIPMDRICNKVVSSCKATCTAAEARAVAKGVTGFQDSDPVRLRAMGKLADAFNLELGIVTTFGNLGADTPTGGGGGSGGGAVACNAKVLQVVVKGKEHRFGFDNRQVALNPAIPIQNICQLVSSGCATTCATAAGVVAASGIRGFSGNENDALLEDMGEVADAFNAALGNRSNFKAAPIDLN